MELLDQCLDVAIAWEPLHVSSGVVPSAFGWGWRPDVRPGDLTKDHRGLFNAIHSYELHNDWTRSKLTPSAARTAEQVLVKYVRANKLIDALLDTIDFHHPPIFLLRHPIDTCISQMRSFGGPERSLEDRIAEWCETNGPIIDRLPELDLTVVHYEDLVLHPRQELERILGASGLTPTTDLAELDVERASATDFNRELQSDRSQQLHKNISQMSNDEKTRIQQIFDRHSLHTYSAFDPLPVLD